MHYEKTLLVKHDPRMGEYCTSGILAVESGVCLDALLDVSPQESLVGQLVRQLNLGDVSLLHFRDVVEDFISIR